MTPSVTQQGWSKGKHKALSCLHPVPYRTASSTRLAVLWVPEGPQVLLLKLLAIDHFLPRFLSRSLTL